MKNGRGAGELFSPGAVGHALVRRNHVEKVPPRMVVTLLGIEILANLEQVMKAELSTLACPSAIGTRSGDWSRRFVFIEC